LKKESDPQVYEVDQPRFIYKTNIFRKKRKKLWQRKCVKGIEAFGKLVRSTFAYSCCQMPIVHVLLASGCHAISPTHQTQLALYQTISHFHSYLKLQHSIKTFLIHSLHFFTFIQ